MYQVVKVQKVRGFRAGGQEAEPFPMQRALEVVRNANDIICTQGARHFVHKRVAAV